MQPKCPIHRRAADRERPAVGKEYHQSSNPATNPAKRQKANEAGKKSVMNGKSGHDERDSRPLQPHVK